MMNNELKNSLPKSNQSIAKTWEPVDVSCYRGLTDLHRALLRQACHERNLKVFIHPGSKLVWSVFSDAYAIRFRKSMPYWTSIETRRVTYNKWKVKTVLNEYGIRVPRGKLFSPDEQKAAMQWYEASGCSAVVVKPVAGSCGRGIASGLNRAEDIERSIKAIHDQKFILEEHIDGTDHRLFVVGGRYVAGARRFPAHVVGDGTHTLEELIERKNSIRKLNPYTRKSLIKLNESDRKGLEHAGVYPSSIIPKDEKVVFHLVANVARGGDSEDITGIVHPDFRKIAERCWEVFPDLASCGVDLITHDITKSADCQDYAVIEINTNADIALHHFPSSGEARDVAGALIDYLFPGAKMAAENTPRKSVKIVIKGNVQKVGYRRWIYRRAILHSLTGYVVNLPGGAVEAVFQGMPNAVEDMIRLCMIGPAKSKPLEISISGEQQSWHDGFAIRRAS